jgi:hypothetical protein
MSGRPSSFPAHVLLAAHDKCMHNRAALQEAGKGGCFYCLKEFTADQIVEWVDGDETALCPFCGIDSVLSFNTDTADQPFLSAMKGRWFGRTVRL